MMAKAQKKIDTSNFPDEPVGVLPSGSINTVNADDPPFKPKITDDDDNEIKSDRHVEDDKPEDDEKPTTWEKRNFRALADSDLGDSPMLRRSRDIAQLARL
jgi:hypothetical protein